MTEVDDMIIRLFAAGSAIVAVFAFSIEARSEGYRIETLRGRAGASITVRPVFRDGGLRWVPFEAPPNACDRMGLVGFEIASGPDRGTCHPDGAGIR